MITELKPMFVELVPKELEEGVLYVSFTYETAIHLCCCGCKNKVVTPFDKGGWTLTEVEGLVSLSPSIGNFQFPCKSHYFIKQNKIQWC